MPRYIRKPIVIEAFKFSGSAAEPGWPDNWLTFKHKFSPGGDTITISTPRGDIKCNKDDYIIKDAFGEFYPLSKDVFSATYEFIDI